MLFIQKCIWIPVIILGIIVYLNIPVFSDHRRLFEAGIFLLISVICLFQVLASKNLVLFTGFEIVFLIFVLYRMARVAFLPSLHVGLFAEILFPVLLYYGLRLFTASSGVENSSRLMLLSTLLLLAIYPGCILSGTGTIGRIMTYLFAPNTSVFSILLAAQLAFVIPFVFYYCIKKGTAPPLINWVILALTGISIFTLILTKGRSGWIGLLVAAAVAAYILLAGSRLRRSIVFGAVITLLLALPFFIRYKGDSSAGRMLIYKVSFSMLKDNWLFGIGEGQFRIQYGLYQSGYFSSHNIDSKEALLADSTVYAFNEPLQILVENGLLGFLLFVAAILCLFLSVIRTRPPENKFALIAAMACLSCITTASLFFYTFHVLPLILYVVWCLSLINTDMAITNYAGISRLRAKVLRVSFILAGLALSVYYLLVLQYRVKSNQAAELLKAGFKSEAVMIYTNLDNSYIKEGETMLAYGKALYNTGKLQPASEVVNDCKKYYTTRELYSLSALTAQEQGRYNEAEKDYLTALYMVPKRMRSRYELFGYYLSIRDTMNAVYWGKSILGMPVKVSSQTALQLQQNTKMILKGFGTECTGDAGLK